MKALFAQALSASHQISPTSAFPDTVLKLPLFAWQQTPHLQTLIALIASALIGDASMFGWFKKKQPSQQPESTWVVAIEDDRISVRDHSGQMNSVAKSDLSGVVVETNDSGPWGADVWWMLFEANDKMACAFPQGATGDNAVIDWLTTLPSFNHGEMIKAMRSTDNAVFAVWRKQL